VVDYTQDGTQKGIDEKIKNVLHAKWESIRRNKEFLKEYYDIERKPFTLKRSIRKVNFWRKWGINPPNPELPYSKVGQRDLSMMFSEGAIRHKASLFEKIKLKSNKPNFVTIDVNINLPKRRIDAEFEYLIRWIFKYRKDHKLISKSKQGERTTIIDLKIFKRYDICEKMKDKNGKINFTKIGKKLFPNNTGFESNVKTLSNQYKQAKKLINGGFRSLK